MADGTFYSLGGFFNCEAFREANFGGAWFFQPNDDSLQYLNVPWFFLGRLISGITGASYSTASAYIADVSPPDWTRCTILVRNGGTEDSV